MRSKTGKPLGMLRITGVDTCANAPGLRGWGRGDVMVTRSEDEIGFRQGSAAGQGADLKHHVWCGVGIGIDTDHG
jgi:hypothetical protein